MPSAKDNARKRAWAAANRDKVRATKTAWRKANRDRQLAATKAWSEANSGRHRAAIKAWRTAHADKVREKARAWREANRGLVVVYTRRRQAAVKRATPPWVNEAEIIAIYKAAAALGVEVDHIFPLRGKNSCGLHVPWNLQLMSKSDNRRKSNKPHPSQLEENPNGTFG